MRRLIWPPFLSVSWGTEAQVCLNFRTGGAVSWTRDATKSHFALGLAMFLGLAFCRSNKHLWVLLL